MNLAELLTNCTQFLNFYGRLLLQSAKKIWLSTISNVFTEQEIDIILAKINCVDTESPVFRKTDDLFAIRQFLKYLPDVKALVFNDRLKQIINNVFGSGYISVKSIYFDKPPLSNWFVSCHQDLTISVKERADVPGFGSWTVKQGQFAVQPPLEILEDNFTIRIHLDDTSKDNGALKVITGSHLKGIYRPETVDRNIEDEVYCEVPKGGIMIMKPLLLHASDRTKNQERRRVIHIEFSKAELPYPLEWAEREEI